MKLSIAKKLGLGFSAIIALMVLSSTVGFVNLAAMKDNVRQMVDKAVPAARACDQLNGGVNQSLAALRGYLILGDESSSAESFKEERAEAWREIDTSLAELESLLSEWDDRDVRLRLPQLKEEFARFRASQKRIEETAHTDDNIAAYKLLFTQADPDANAMLKALTALIDAEKAEQATRERKDLLASLADLRGSFAQSKVSIRAYLISGDPAFKREFERHWETNRQVFDRVRAQLPLMTPAQVPQWETFVSLRASYEPLPQRLFALRESEEWNRAEWLLESDAALRARRICQTLDEITAAAEAWTLDSRAQMNAAHDRVTHSLWMATMAGVVIGSVIAVALSRKFVSMVRALADRADEISQGDLTGSALVVKSSDELSQLAGSFDSMLGNLRDLTGQVLSVTENVNAAASQVSSSAKQQACSSKEQASTVQEVTSTMQEIAQSGTQIVEKARQVAAAAEAAVDQSKSGISAVQNTNATMESIREQVEEVAENIVALSEKTQAVGDIISTVNDIAEQSNLLALNATIEAAEAGDDGNRFSVVANEMKNLADQAKECTVQVRNILGEIQKGINSAVMLTEEAVKRVELGKQHADNSEEAIRRMSETTGESVQAFQQIIGATSQQQVGFEQVTKGMQDIDQATQQTAAGTAQLEQAVVSLSAMSQQLKSAVSNYKLQA